MLTRRVLSRAMTTSFATLRFQSARGGGGRDRGRVDQPPVGRGRLSEEQIIQAQRQQQANVARREPVRQAPPEQTSAEAEDDTPPPPPKKPEGSKYVVVDIRPDGVAIVRMNRAPVNSLNLEMFTELIEWFMWLSTEESGAKALILTSDLKTVFSAGLDINELHKPEPERFQDFWFSFQETWMILNTFPKPVIAAINGNSPAGGCVLALATDYRVMARASLKDPQNPKPYRIGLNETKLGIVAPPWVMRSLAYVVGDRKAERMLQLGETPTADEALAIGLIDRVVEEDQVADAALQEALRFAAIPSEARWLSKDLARQSLTGFFNGQEARNYDCEFFANLVQNPDVVDNVGKYLAKLGGGKK